MEAIVGLEVDVVSGPGRLQVGSKFNGCGT
jgi:hypothetical protein